MIERMLAALRARERLEFDRIVVGRLDPAIVSILCARQIPIHTIKIHLTSRGLSHLARSSKRKRGAGLKDDDILAIPDYLAHPDAIFLERCEEKNHLLFCVKNGDRAIKIVVDTKGYEKRKIPLTLIKTAGYIRASDMKNSCFELVWGRGRYKGARENRHLSIMAACAPIGGTTDCFHLLSLPCFYYTTAAV